MKQKVVVIGHGYTSRLGVIRALGLAGYEVIVIVMTGFKRDGKTLNDTKPIDCYSKYVDQVYFCPPDRQRLVDLLLNECIDPEQKVVIFTDSDFSASTVDLFQKSLNPYFLFPQINDEPGAIVAWMDKERQKKAAESVGLNVAHGRILDIIDGKFEITGDIRYPCFPKPLVTIFGGKNGLKRCDNEGQLRIVLDKFSDKYSNIKVLVEDFKKIDVEHALMGVTDGHTVIIPGVIRTLSLACGGHFGVAKKGQLMPVSGFEELIDRFKSLILHTGYKGIFDIDFYKSEGKYFFCEINFRYGGSGFVYTKMGVNLPDIMVKMLLGAELKDVSVTINDSVTFINERMCKDDWAEGYLSTREFFKLLKSAEVSFIWDKDDVEPGKHFRKSLKNPVLRLKRIVKRVIRR